MIPTDRATFKEYCLESLGKPVITINVADQQVENRVDDAIQKFQEAHYDAVEEEWLIYNLTQVDIDNGFITIPDDILTVIKTINLGELGGTGSDDLFSYNYQVAYQNLSPFQSLDMINYHMTMTNIQMVYDMVNAAPRINHTRYLNKVELHRDITDAVVGTPIALNVYKTIDPGEHGKVYNDIWLKKYATALIKLQWGNNMKKHSEVQLLGGVTVNGQQIYDEAREEIQTLEEQLDRRYSLPIDFTIG